MNKCENHLTQTYSTISGTSSYECIAMIGENRQLVADEPVEFEK